MSSNFVCHVEWGTQDPAGLSQFLSQLFGWEFKPFTPTYLMYLPADGGVSAGINQNDMMKSGGSPSVSVRVADLDAMLIKARELGGSIAASKVQMGSGAFAFIQAPDGNIIGLQQL